MAPDTGTIDMVNVSPAEVAWRRHMRHPAFVCVLLALATLLAYWPVTRAEFINYDDPEYVTENPRVLAGLSWEGVKWAFTSFYASNWHPLTWLSHMLDVELYGPGPSGPHCVNLALHVGNSLLLFLVLRRMTGAHWRSALVAGFFALHPLHVESVAWVAERKDVLSTYWGLLCLFAYGLYVERKTGQAGGGHPPQAPAHEPASLQRAAHSTATTSLPASSEEHGRQGSENAGLPGLHAARSYGLALMFFALGLMSKPMLVTLPFVMLLLDYWPLHRFRLSFGSSQLPALCRLLWEKAPFFALSAAASLVTAMAQRRAMQPLITLEIEDRIANAVVSYSRYLGKALWPTVLALPYPHPGQWPWVSVGLGLAMTVGLCVAAAWFARKLPFLFVGWFWFLGTLVPVIGLVQVGDQAMADRYTYLPLVGAFVLLVWGAHGLAKRYENAVTPALVVLALLTLGTCGLLSRRQVAYWHDSESLFGHAIKVTSGNYVALNNIGVALFDRGRLDEAAEYYRRTLEVRSNYPDGLNNLGAILDGKGSPEAEQLFRRALFFNPSHSEALINLGNALAKRGQYAEAAAAFTSGLKLKPDRYEARNNLANVLIKLGRAEEAVGHYSRALRSQPGNARIHRNLASALASSRKFDEAIWHYRQALKAEPDDPGAHYALGLILAIQGQWDDAIQHYEYTLSRVPTNVEAQYNLGYALRVQSRLPEAAIALRGALRLKADFPLAHYNLACVLADQGQQTEAIAHLRDALRLKPDYEEARQKLTALGSGPEDDKGTTRRE